MNTIEVRIYNPDLELQGIIDEFSSLIWIRRYQGAGEFELHTPYSEESRQLLGAGNLVQKFDGKPSMEAGVIEFLQMNHEEIVVKGRFWESYLDFHMISGTYEADVWGRVENVLRRLVYDVIEAGDIPPLALGENHWLQESRDFQVTSKSLLNLSSRLCRATALGFRIWPDFEAKKMYFEVYKGVDRTSDSASKVVFSETYDNMMNETYTFNNTNYRNVAVVTQLDPIGLRVIKIYNPDQLTGLEKREAGVVSSVSTEDGPEQMYADMLLAGETALANYQIAETFNFSTDPYGTFKYREDYDLGDLVIVNHIAWNINQTRRITEIEEDYENGTMNVILTCGDPLPETIDFKEGY